MNGLIAETESLLKGVIATVDENWDLKKIDYYATLI